MENSMEISLKTRNKIIIWPSNLTTVHTPWDNHNSKRHMYPNVCCCSLTQACLTLCDPMACSMPGFPIHHHLTELAQTHVRRVSDAIQPSHSLLSASPPTLIINHVYFFIKLLWVSYYIYKIYFEYFEDLIDGLSCILNFDCSSYPLFLGLSGSCFQFLKKTTYG